MEKIDPYFTPGIAIAFLQYFTSTTLAVYLLPNPYPMVKRKWLHLVAIAIVSAIAYHYLNILAMPLNWLLTTVYLFYRTKKVTLTLMYTSLSNICFLLSDYVVEFFCADTRIGVNHIESYNEAYLRAGANCGMALALAFLLKQLLHIWNKRSSEGVRGQMLIMFYATVTNIGYMLYVVFDRYILLHDLYRIQPGMVAVIFFAYLALAFILIFFSIRLTREQEKHKYEQKRLKEFMEYTADLEKNYQLTRKILHDSQNIFLSLRDYVERQDMEGLRSYYFEVLEPEHQRYQKSQSYFTALSKVKCIPLKSILYTKLMKAQAMGIAVHCNANADVDELGISTNALIRIVSNLLDNAIEESEENPEAGIIQVGILRDQEKTSIMIRNKLVQSKQADISLLKIYQNGYSTKGENRGMGLAIIADILKGNPGITLDTQVEEDAFIQILDLYERK